jgi:hypothetical protein
MDLDAEVTKLHQLITAVGGVQKLLPFLEALAKDPELLGRIANDVGRVSQDIASLAARVAALEGNAKPEPHPVQPPHHEPQPEPQPLEGGAPMMQNEGAIQVPT